MKASCPRCRRGTEIEQDAGDFPMRCEKCGALVRRNAKRSEEAAGQRSPEVRRIERGTLAGLLVARSNSEEMSPAIIHASSYAGGSGIAAAVCVAEGPRTILRPESRRAIARAAARQKALRKAQLRASMQSFGALSWAGLTLIALLLLGAMVLKAQAMWQHPAPPHADVMRGNP